MARSKSAARRRKPAAAPLQKTLETALARFQQGQPADTASLCAEILKSRPADPSALHLLGAAYLTLGQPDDAVESLAKALAVDKRNPEIHTNLAAALSQVNRNEEALHHIARAIELEPGHADGFNNLGWILRKQGKPEQAINAFDDAVARRADFPAAVSNRALARLSLGQFSDGWRDYLTRKSTRDIALNLWRDPLPDILDGRRVFVLRDQGLGDELFFLRFAPQLRSRGATIVYIAEPRLVAMIGRAGIVDMVIGDGHGMDHAPQPGEPQIAVGDLPHVLGMADGDTPPAPYIIPALDERVIEMRDRLTAAGPGPYVGVTWRAGQQQHNNLSKIVPADKIAACLAAAPGTLIALQRNPQPGELSRLSQQAGREMHDFTALNGDLEGMLALQGLLDDYVCVSNTNVHLREARGGTCRVLVPIPPEFRWMAQGNESPWYPGTRIYRQEPDGDWAPALAELKADLGAGSASGRDRE